MSCTTTPDRAYRRFVGNRVAAICGCWATLVLPFACAGFVNQGPVVCPVRGVIGVPCPGCGLTRAFCAMSQFDFGSAIAFNALCLPLGVLFLATPIIALVELARGARCRFYACVYSTRAAWFCGAVVTTYHVGRIAWWAASGALVEGYLKSSWTYQLTNWLTSG